MSWWLDITDLDDDQKKVLELPPDGNYLIVGPPGSGKTNLLLIRAEYLIRSGKPNVLVLMFNAPLHDFVVRGGVNYDVPRTKIRKMMSWEIVLLRENGADIEDLPDEDLTERRRELATRVLKLLGSNPHLQGSIPCLLVDEVQDCIPEEIEVFFRCAENVCFAGDDRQRLFNPKNVIPELKKRPGLKLVEIHTHYRIGEGICQAADIVGKSAGLEPIAPGCNYTGPTASAKFVPCESDDAQADQIIANLGPQLQAYPDELLAVAAPRKVDLEFLRAKLEASPLAPLLLPHRKAGSDDDPNQRIYVAHLQEIKGLEFRAVHLGLMQHVSKLGANQKRIAYTAMTRAKTSLLVYYTGGIPGYLEQAKASLEPPKPSPKPADLFPKKKKKGTK